MGRGRVVGFISRAEAFPTPQSLPGRGHSLGAAYGVCTAALVQHRVRRGFVNTFLVAPNTWHYAISSHTRRRLTLLCNPLKLHLRTN